MREPMQHHLTPWVTRLLAGGAAVLVLLLAVFSAPSFTAALVFDPAHGWTRPWTVATHLAAHLSPLHLAINALVLWVFGPAVERRLGGRRFLLLVASAGAASALVASALAGVATLPPLAGAGGALLGVAMAHALLWPDTEVPVFPLPVPLSAATVVGVLAVVDLLAAFRFAADGLAHFGHLGGLLTGYLWYRAGWLAAARGPAPPRAPQRPVMAAPLPMRLEERAAVSPPAPARAETTLAAGDFERAEMDRVLDKISTSGLASLTPAEQRFLREVAERKKGRAP